jgi:hypothetical protein
MKFPGEPNGDKNNFKWVFTNGNSLEKKNISNKQL